jgi:hypothetical protein
MVKYVFIVYLVFLCVSLSLSLHPFSSSVLIILVVSLLSSSLSHTQIVNDDDPRVKAMQKRKSASASTSNSSSSSQAAPRADASSASSYSSGEYVQYQPAAGPGAPGATSSPPTGPRNTNPFGLPDLIVGGYLVKATHYLVAAVALFFLGMESFPIVLGALALYTYYNNQQLIAQGNPPPQIAGSIGFAPTPDDDSAPSSGHGRGSYFGNRRGPGSGTGASGNRPGPGGVGPRPRPGSNIRSLH